jgi:hypothetical protein
VVSRVEPSKIQNGEGSAERAGEGGQSDHSDYCGLSHLSRQDGNVSFETILPEVVIEGESVVDSMMVDQSKAGAVNEAKVFVIVSNENRLGRLFNAFVNTENLNPGLVERSDEFNSGPVTDFEADQCVRLG